MLGTGNPEKLTPSLMPNGVMILHLISLGEVKDALSIPKGVALRPFTLLI
jgi:hypothetical protein